MTLTTREIQRFQQWQNATMSTEVTPCNLLFCCLRPSLPAFDKAHASMALPSLSANSLCFVSFFFSGRKKKERNEGKKAYYGYNAALPKYAFNAKELDEETGMYYYEARYYKPPVFTSRDPMFEKYFWMTPYAYCANNPVKYVDPDGRIIDGVTYNKKTKSFTYSEEAIARGTDKYIEARMATKSGRRSIMLMVRNRRTTFTFYVVKEPLFGKNGDEYEQIDGITVLNNETMSNVSIYVSTYTFHSDELNPKDLSNVLIFDGEKVLFRQSIDKKNIKNPSYSNQWPILKKINDFIYDNPVRSEKEYIHAIGAHEEWHIYQKGNRHSQQNEKSANRRELSARKEYWESVPDCLIY